MVRDFLYPISNLSKYFVKIFGIILAWSLLLMLMAVTFRDGLSHTAGHCSMKLEVPKFSEFLQKFLHLTGCLKKKWDLFFDQYLDQIKLKSAGYIFHLKG